MPVFDCQNQLVTFIMPLFINAVHFIMHLLLNKESYKISNMCYDCNYSKRSNDLFLVANWLQSSCKDYISGDRFMIFSKM